MSESNNSAERWLSDADSYRLALAAMHSEKARLTAKYDARIEELQQAVADAEKPAAKGGDTAVAGRATKPTRRTKSTKPAASSGKAAAARPTSKRTR